MGKGLGIFFIVLGIAVAFYPVFGLALIFDGFGLELPFLDIGLVSFSIGGLLVLLGGHLFFKDPKPRY